MATDLSNKSRDYLVKQLQALQPNRPLPKDLDFNNKKIKEILLFEEPSKYYDSEAKVKTKKKNTKVTSLRSSKDKKFGGHTTYRT
jgi:hypothetical protein|tara:strand:+ start:469 stop:723 length:255 start_codon:yes stop_codon:yes gene_type:complete